MGLRSVDTNVMEVLSNVLPDDTLRPVAPRYLEEQRGLFNGQGGVLALPRATRDVSKLLETASHLKVPVVPYGGGTGLVGGQVMPNGPIPILLSMERMSAIRNIFPAENVVVAEAGAILADVQTAAQSVDRLFPLSLASEGSCQIGGNLATNAGGLNVLRYGNARDLCLGLEVVLPDGRIWNGLTRLRKDNTGYDLRNLLIGSEGTLGVITAAALRLFAQPSRRGTAMIAVASPAAAIELLSMARAQLGEMVSAFELIHGQGLRFIEEAKLDARQPFAPIPDWSVLIELGLPSALDPEEELMALFSKSSERGLALDGVIAQSETQRRDLWDIREQIPQANKRIGSVSSHDISIPISEIPTFINRAGKELSKLGDLRINGFGHLGDGNLHYNVFPAAGRDKAEYANVKSEVKEIVYGLTTEMGGSISAEHGIGRLKSEELVRYGDPVRIAAMHAVKKALDPLGIMNPGAVLK